MVKGAESLIFCAKQYFITEIANFILFDRSFYLISWKEYSCRLKLMT